jgi:hypothetical protein
MPRRRDANELREAFEVQRSALISSCRAYDEGQKWEALRLATAIYILVRDGGKKNRSILTQMGKRNSMEFAVPISKAADPRNLVSYTPLVMLRLGEGGANFLPRQDEFPSGRRMLRFSEWWDRDLVFRSGGGKHRMTRKKLVFSLRNLDGGAHYDEEILDPNYIEMTHGKSWMSISPDGTKRPVRQLELASMRQIAWEVLDSLECAGV